MHEGVVIRNNILKKYIVYEKIEKVTYDKLSGKHCKRGIACLLQKENNKYFCV